MPHTKNIKELAQFYHQQKSIQELPQLETSSGNIFDTIYNKNSAIEVLDETEIQELSGIIQKQIGIQQTFKLILTHYIDDQQTWPKQIIREKIECNFICHEQYLILIPENASVKNDNDKESCNSIQKQTPIVLDISFAYLEIYYSNIKNLKQGELKIQQNVNTQNNLQEIFNKFKTIYSIKISKLNQIFEFTVKNDNLIQEKSNVIQESLTSNANDECPIQIGQSYNLMNNLTRNCIQKYNKRRFQIISELGIGSSGQVLLVRDLGHFQQSFPHTYINKENICPQKNINEVCQDDLFALKAISKDNLNENQQRQLINEIIIQRHFNSNLGIVHIHEVFEDQDKLYLLLDYFQGGNLKQYIQKYGKLSEEEVKPIIIQILKTLETLQEASIIHRDIKPENILIHNLDSFHQPIESQNEDVIISLADFGLACHFSKNQNYSKVKCGTPGYIAPEILQQGLYSKKVDMFGLGCLIYFMLTGKELFQGSNTAQVLEQNKLCDVRSTVKRMKNQSVNVKQFLLLLLTDNHIKRMSAREALQHSWIMSNSSTEDENAKLSEKQRKSDSIILSTKDSQQPLYDSNQQQTGRKDNNLYKKVFSKYSKIIYEKDNRYSIKQTDNKLCQLEQYQQICINLDDVENQQQEHNKFINGFLDEQSQTQTHQHYQFNMIFNKNFKIDPQSHDFLKFQSNNKEIMINQQVQDQDKKINKGNLNKPDELEVLKNKSKCKRLELIQLNNHQEHQHQKITVISKASGENNENINISKNQNIDQILESHQDQQKGRLRKQLSFSIKERNGNMSGQQSQPGFIVVVQGQNSNILPQIQESLQILDCQEFDLEQSQLDEYDLSINDIVNQMQKSISKTHKSIINQPQYQRVF
eukprot:403340048